MIDGYFCLGQVIFLKWGKKYFKFDCLIFPNIAPQ